MRFKVRYLLEVLFIIFLISVGFLLDDISSTFFNGKNYIFVFYLIYSYVIIRVIFNLLFICLKFKYSGYYKESNGEIGKIKLEKSIYGHIAVISFLLIFTKVLMVAFITLFIIFGLLYLLSTLSFEINYNKNLMAIKNVENGENNDLELYGENEEEPYNFYDAYYYSKEGFELLNIITNNTFGILNNYYTKDPIITIDKLIKSNYLFYIQRSMYFGDINIFCGIINSYLEKLDLKIKLKKDDILKYDDDLIKNRRQDFIDTLNNDLKLADKVLNKKKYHIITVGLYDDYTKFLCISIVSSDVYKKLLKFKKKEKRK